MSKRITAHAALIGANIIYGINYTVVKEIIPDWMHPFGLVLSRIIGTTLLFWLFSIFTIKEKIDKKDFRTLLFAGIFGVATNQMLFLKGLSTTSPIDASIIMTANPILVLILAAIILHEKITLQKIIGIIIGASGALLIILNSGKIGFASESFVGNILIFFNSLSYGIYLIIIKPLMTKYQPITIIKWVFTFGLFFVFPFSIKPFLQINWMEIPSIIYWAIAFVIIGSTFLAYFLNIFSLKRLSPTTVSIYIYSQPILASLVAVFAEKDRLSLTKIIAVILVFTGVFLVSKQSKLISKTS